MCFRRDLKTLFLKDRILLLYDNDYFKRTIDTIRDQTNKVDFR